MMRKITAMLAAFMFAGATFAPVAEARDHRDGYRHYRHYDHYRDRDNGDAVAAGAVGLILGLALGSMASEPRGGCYDRCAPPPRCYDRCGPPPPPPCYDRCRNSRESYYDRREDPRYYDDRGGSAYEDDYALEGGDPRYQRESSRCMRAERQWDRYAQRYVTVDVPC